jgi:hypothetical protein
MKNRHDSFIAIANTPEPSADGRTKPPLPSPLPHRCATGERERRMGEKAKRFRWLRHRQLKCRPSGPEHALCDWWVQPISTSNSLPHGRDARATMWVS